MGDTVIKKRLHYDSVTGKLTWLSLPKNASSAKVGEEAGFIDSNGYRIVYVDGRQYKAHRLCWFLYYGNWPKQMIDHIDGNKSNNCIDNLRDVSRSRNGLNRQYPRGVWRSSDGAAWEAHIRIDGERKYLGRFATEEAAWAARKEAECLIP